MTGKITNFDKTKTMQHENTSLDKAESLVVKVQNKPNLALEESALHLRTAADSNKSETITDHFIEFCKINFGMDIEGSREHQTKLITQILAGPIYSKVTPNAQKIAFLEAYIPFLSLHFKEPIFEDHLFSCFHHLKKLKPDPQLTDRITALEDQIRTMLAPQNNLTHRHVLKSLADIEVLPLYQSYADTEAAIGKNNVWQLVLDGSAQHDPEDLHGGIIGYEMREKGSVDRLINGYKFTLSEPIFTPLTPQFIQNIHRNVASLAVAEHREAGQWGNSGVECSYSRIYTPADENGLKYIPKGNFSHSGAFENMLDTSHLLMPTTSHIQLDGSITSPKLRFESCHDDDPGGNMQKLIDLYETKMAETPKKNKYERLKTIVQFIHIAEINHPFQDGNCRTICTCLLNRELIRHGFPPTLLWDPNYLDMLSTEEIMLEVLEGMKDFATLAKTKIYARAMTPEMLAARRDKQMQALTQQLLDPTVLFQRKFDEIRKLLHPEKNHITRLDLHFTSNSGFSDENVGILIRTLPNLTELSISGMRTNPQILFNQNKTYPKLTDFRYMNTIMIPADLSAYMIKYPNLQILTLSNVSFSPKIPDNPRMIIPAVYGHLPHLKELSFATENIHNPNAISKKTSNLEPHLDAIIKSGPNLERVILPNAYTDEDLKALKETYPMITFVRADK